MQRFCERVRGERDDRVRQLMMDATEGWFVRLRHTALQQTPHGLDRTAVVRAVAPPPRLEPRAELIRLSIPALQMPGSSSASRTRYTTMKVPGQRPKLSTSHSSTELRECTHTHTAPGQHTPTVPHTPD